MQRASEVLTNTGDASWFGLFELCLVMPITGVQISIAFGDNLVSLKASAAEAGCSFFSSTLFKDIRSSSNSQGHCVRQLELLACTADHAEAFGFAPSMNHFVPMFGLTAEELRLDEVTWVAVAEGQALDAEPEYDLGSLEMETDMDSETLLAIRDSERELAAKAAFA